MKYCTYYKKDYHTIDEYHIKYLKLASKTWKKSKSLKCWHDNLTLKNNINQSIRQYYTKKDLVIFSVTFKVEQTLSQSSILGH